MELHNLNVMMQRPYDSCAVYFTDGPKGTGKNHAVR